jgi:endonuclease YncB( thermonuclease family)
MKNFNRKISSLLSLLIILNILTCGFTKSSEYIEVDTKVVKVISGDVLKVKSQGKEQIVKLLGVNIPTKTGQKMAINLAKKLNGKTVHIKYKKSDVDKYGRILVLMYVKHVLFNQSLLICGAAAVVSIGLRDTDLQKQFKSFESKAKDKSLGIWSDSANSIQEEITQDLQGVATSIKKDTTSIINEGIKAFKK